MSAPKATPTRIAKAERSAAFVPFEGIGGSELAGQIVSQASAMRTHWIIPAEPTGREFQGCLLVWENRDGGLFEIPHGYENRTPAPDQQSAPGRAA